VKTVKKFTKKLLFSGLGIEASESPVYERSDGLCPSPKVIHCTGLFISPSGISDLECATTKTDTAERSIPVGREFLASFFVLGAMAYLQVPPLGGSRDEKWRS